MVCQEQNRTEQLHISLRSTSEAADMAVTSQKQSQGSALFNVIETPHGIQGNTGNPTRIPMQFNNLAESNTGTKIPFFLTKPKFMGDIRCNVWEISTLRTRCDLNHVTLAQLLKLRHKSVLTSEAEGAKTGLIQLFPSF